MKGRLEEKIRQQEHELTSQKTAYSTLLVQEPDLKRRFEEAKAQFDAELGKKSQEIERLGEQIRGKDASLTDLERKIAAQVAELEQLKRIVESFDTEKTILTGDYTRQIKELEAKVATLAGQVKAADKKVREATAREKDIKQLLEQKIAQIQELEKEKLEQPFEIGNPLRRKQMQTTTRVSPKVLQSLGVYRNPAAIRR
jgi:chromosome segregation ATPase